MKTIERGQESLRSEVLLSSVQLSSRWGIKVATLRNWRWQGNGCPYVKLGRCVAYRLSDVERFEQERLKTSTSQVSGNHGQ